MMKYTESFAALKVRLCILQPFMVVSYVAFLFESLWQKCIACKIYLPPATIFPLLRVLGENLQWSAALDLLQSEKWREEVTFEKAEKIQALTCILQGVVEHTRKNSVDKAKVEEFLSYHFLLISFLKVFVI